MCLTQDTWISIERPFSSHVVCREEINKGPGVGYVECRAVRSSGGTGGTVQYYCLLSTRRVTSVVCASASRQNRVRVKRNVSSSYTATEVRFASLCKRRTFVSATYDNEVGCVDRKVYVPLVGSPTRHQIRAYTLSTTGRTHPVLCECLVPTRNADPYFAYCTHPLYSDYCISRYPPSMHSCTANEVACKVATSQCSRHRCLVKSE